jgi:hypothetical protein
LPVMALLTIAMISFNDQVNQLHAAFLSARGLDPDDLPLDPCSERQWLQAHNWGIKPDDVKLVVKARMKLNAAGGKWSLHIRRLVGDEDDLSQFKMELAEIKAGMRKPTHNPAKALVLVQSGRSGEIEQGPARNLAQIFAGMREKTA